MHFGWEGAMPAASLETTLELWSATLRQAKQRIRPLFAAPPVAASANAFLDGLLGAERRKTSWMRAEAAGDPGPWRQQAILVSNSKLCEEDHALARRRVTTRM